MKQIFGILIFLSVLMVACDTESDTAVALKHADAIININPDSAISILQRLDTTGISNSLRSHYSLLITKAADKANLPLPDRNLIDNAVRFYRGHGDSLEAQVMYYKGVVEYDNRDYGRALVSFMQSHEIAELCCDLFYKAMSSRALADVYSSVLAFDAAARCDSMAIEEFYAAGRPIYAMHERYTLPYYLIQCGRINEADALLDENAKEPFFTNSSGPLSWYYATRALSCFENKDWFGAIHWYDSCAQKVPYYMTSTNWSRLALSYISVGDRIRAIEALDSAKVKSNGRSDTVYTTIVDAELYSLMGNYKSAFKMIDNFYCQYNYKRNKLLSHPYTTILTDHYASLSNDRLRELNMSKTKTLFFAIITFLVVVIAVGIYLLYLKKMRFKEIETENLLSDIYLLKEKLKADSDKLKSVTSYEGSLVKFIDQLFVIADNAPISDEGNKYLRKTLNSTLDMLKKSQVLSMIEVIANRIHDDAVSKLRSQVAALTPKQINYFILKSVGFSNATICCILNIKTINALHQTKSRLKNTIENADAPDKQLFIKIMYDKY